jgi:hypothetical protein
MGWAGDSNSAHTRRESGLKGFPMNKRRLVTMMIIVTLMVVALKGYETVTRLESGGPLEYYQTTLTPLPLPDYNQEEAYAAAQATLAYGQSEMMELSHQATVVSLNMDQAANAAAQVTIDHHQRQLMELSIRATEVSQNVARAAATQHSINEQTQMVWNATATAQSQAATATYSAYILNVTQTAQAQAVLEVQANQSAQANATRAAHSLTATPWAAIQADIARTRNEVERRAWWEEFVVISWKVVLLALVVLLLIVGGVMGYQRLMPVLELRLRTMSRYNARPFLLVDGRIVDPDPPHLQLVQREMRRLERPRLPSVETPQVEIVGPAEPSVINWVTEAEGKLRTDGRIQP